MSTINTDLIAHIYAASESPLTNDELALLQIVGGDKLIIPFC